MGSIRSRRVVTGGEVREATVSFQEGVITEIGGGSADLDFGDLVVMPGLVDSHVHVNEPGRTDWEGFETATRAAAAGGVTTIVDMPLNSIPPTIDRAALEAKRAAAKGKLSVDVAFWGGLVPGSEKHLDELVEEGVCGFKSFLVDSGVPEFPPMTLQGLRSALPVMEAPLLLHAEDPEELGELDGDGYAAYLATRPVEAEAKGVAAAAALSAESGARIHVLHLSSSSGVDLIGRGPPGLTGETCPHYLTFAAEDIPEGATQFKCAPPIREADHREALWEGLRRRRLTMVVSDHSPAPAELKQTGSFQSAWGGISSLQLRLPATWTGAAARGFELIDLTPWLSTAPAALAGLNDRKGSIAVGKEADFVVWDPDGSLEVRGAELLHRHPVTPYEGLRLRGTVRATILRGTMVFDGNTALVGHGRMLRRR